MKFGKQPARHDERTLLFSTYRSAHPLAITVPQNYGHYEVVQNLGMLGNDSVGDCVFAGGAHETMLWTGEVGKQALFDDQSVLSDYSAVTGYDPSDPNTDQGTDVLTALNYRRKTGLIDARGVRHKIGAYVALEPGNWDQLLEAMFIFSAVGVGINFPSSAMKQFDAGKPWSVVPNSHFEGGHYIPAVGRSHNYWDLFTWGKVQRATRAFYEKCCDEAYAILSEEMLDNGFSPEGFDLAQMTADLKVVVS